jgi:PAS domain S-box-containing protein
MLRSVALQNAQSIRAARDRVEEDLFAAKEALQLRMAELERANELVRAIAENAASCLVLLDDHGIATYMNPSATAETGHSLEDVAKRSFLDVLHAAGGDSGHSAAACPIRKAREAMLPLKGYRDLFRRRDGSTFPVSCTLSPLQRDKRAAGDVLEFRDITHELIAHKALEDANDRKDDFFASLSQDMAESQAAILDALPASIALIDGVGKILVVNESWRRFGQVNGLQAPDSALGANYLAVCGRAEPECDEAQRAGAGIRRLLRGEIHKFAIEYSCHSPFERRWFRMTVAPLFGGSSGAVVMHMDVTEERAAALRLERNEALLQMAGQMSRVGGWAVDLPDLTLSWSEEVCSIYGLPPGVVPTVEEGLAFYAPEFIETVRKSFDACMQEGTPFDLEVQIISALGQRVWVRCLGEARRDADGAVRRVEGAFQDISDRKRIEQEIFRHAARLAAVVEVQQTLSTSDESPERLFESIAEMAQRVLQADGMVFETIDGEELVCRAGSGIGVEQIGVRRDIFSGLSGQAILQDRTLRCDDTESDQRVDLAVSRHLGVRSMTLALLKSESGPIGTLRLLASQPDRFSDADSSILELLAESLSAVIQRRLHAEKLRASEAQYRLLFVGSPQPMWVLDPLTQKFLSANNAASKHYGYTEQEFTGMTIRDLQALDYLPLFAQRAPLLMQQSGTRTVHARHRTKEGAILEVDVTLDDIEFHARRVILVLADDVTERMRMEEEAARANRALKMLSRFNEALIRADDETLLLENVCALAVEIGGFPMAWVGYAMDDGKRIVPRANAGNESGFLSALQLKWEGAPLGPAGRAIDGGRPVVVPDVGTETLSAWSADARLHGFLGVVCLPLSDSVRTFGVLVLHLSEVRELPADELLLLEELADNLAFGIVTLRARAEQRRTNAAVLAMAQGVSASTGAEFFEKLTFSLVEALGADVGFISQLPPGDDGPSRTISAVVDGHVVPALEYVADCPTLEKPDADNLHIVSRNAYRLYPQSSCLTSAKAESYVSATMFGSQGQAIGVICVLFRQPLTQPQFVASTLRIFASRAAAELERQIADVQVRRQAALIDEAPNGIYVQDLAGRIVFWNKGAERLYGWPAAYVIGHEPVELFRIAAREVEVVERLVRETGSWSGEVVKATASGSLVTVDCRVTLLRDPGGKPRSVLVIDTDITERKALEQQFLRAQRLDSIGTLAGGIAHDLNNMLMPIIMGTTLLKRLDVDERRLRTIDNIARSAHRGAELVKQVLSFARGVAGARISVRPDQVVNEVTAMAESTFPKNIALETDIAEDIRFIVGDPTQINQVLLNLCVNARDALPNGGRIVITARNIDVDDKFAVSHGGVAGGTYVLLEVSDNGTGMTKEIMDRIFEPFFTTKELGKSTGLGLSTTFGIIRGHGGFLNVYSELGRGSVFRTYFPAEVAEAAGAAASLGTAAADALPRGHGELILVVDDDVSILSMTRETLEEFGYTVVTAEDGLQALGVYTERQSDIALVLTDMMMPVMGGSALITALQRLDPKVKIVAASGLSTSEVVARTSSAGVRHFLVKPYSAEIMLATIFDMLRKSEE